MEGLAWLGGGKEESTSSFNKRRQVKNGSQNADADRLGKHRELHCRVTVGTMNLGEEQGKGFWMALDYVQLGTCLEPALYVTPFAYPGTLLVLDGQT